MCDNSIISDSAYHELAMQCESLPRKSTLVACRRNEINSKFEVMCTPGLLPGSAVAYVTKTCSRSFRLLIRVVIYQTVHIDK